MVITFDQKGTFEALYAAEAWCRKHGISYGSGCATGPTGLLCGNFAIAKWRNLTPAERRELHGVMDGEMREGPVRITMKDEALAAHGLLQRIQAESTGGGNG